MKKNIFIFILTLLSLNLFSQDYKHKISANVGTSLWGTTTNLLNSINLEFINKSYASPVFQLGYSAKLSPIFSLGVAVSHQKFNFNITFADKNITNADILIKRSNVGIRGLFHYLDNNVIDLYSGGRVGLTVWKINANAEALDNFLNSYDFNLPFNTDYSMLGTALSFQLVLFGADFYITKNIGINTEINLGTPYYSTVGLNYKF